MGKGSYIGDGNEDGEAISPPMNIPSQTFLKRLCPTENTSNEMKMRFEIKLSIFKSVEEDKW